MLKLSCALAGALLLAVPALAETCKVSADAADVGCAIVAEGTDDASFDADWLSCVRESMEEDGFEEGTHYKITPGRTGKSVECLN